MRAGGGGSRGLGQLVGGGGLARLLAAAGGRLDRDGTKSRGKALEALQREPAARGGAVRGKAPIGRSRRYGVRLAAAVVPHALWAELQRAIRVNDCDHPALLPGIADRCPSA